MPGRIGVTKMSIQPMFPVYIMLGVLILACLVTAVLIARNQQPGKARAFSLFRMFIIYGLIFVIGLRPVKVESNYQFSTKNLDVILVFDTTMSMYAQDYNGRRERMTGALADAKTITNELAGSSFAIVSFSNTSSVISPFTQDLTYTESLIDSLKTPKYDSQTATGTNLSTPYNDIEALMRSSERKENHKTIIFLFSDGESTTDKQALSYESLAQYTDGGAILGYGSKEGGKMRYNGSNIKDPTTNQDAVSVIDETTLNRLANELQITYLNRNTGNTALNGIIQLVRENSKTLIENGKDAELYIDTYYYFAIALALMLLWEVCIFIRKGRL